MFSWKKGHFWETSDICMIVCLVQPGYVWREAWRLTGFVCGDGELVAGGAAVDAVLGDHADVVGGRGVQVDDGGLIEGWGDVLGGDGWAPRSWGGNKKKRKGQLQNKVLRLKRLHHHWIDHQKEKKAISLLTSTQAIHNVQETNWCVFKFVNRTTFTAIYTSSSWVHYCRPCRCVLYAHKVCEVQCRDTATSPTPYDCSERRQWTVWA